jgi:solute carrier family 23 (nucleobase transporter), member 1
MSDEVKKEAQGWVVYPIGSKPKIGLSILLGIQQYLTMFGATVLIPFIVAGAFEQNGIPMPGEALALLISTMFFVSGIATLIQQSPIGNKLPIIQGGTFSFLGPMFAIVGVVAAKGLGWEAGLADVSMCVIFASFFEIILGYTGLLGLVKRAISPITIGPTIAMIGLALYGIGAPWMAGNWTISFITLVALILFSQVFSRYSRVFLLFPVLLAILVGWLASLIGTVSGAIPEGNPANLTGQLGLIQSAKWFSLRPAVPFKWGFPTFGEGILVAGSLGMLAGYLGSMVESIGDYYSCARIAEAPVPTEKMISRGLGAEGIGCFIAGIFQTANGTTSYSENIGSIGLTRVASRRVVRAGALVMLVLPLFGKFGATLATLPQPVVGAMFVGLFGLIAAVGLSNLQFVNLNNARNLFIIGLAFFAGLSFPAHFNANPIAWTSSQVAEILGSICQTILTTGMAVTALFGIVLDNLLPGATRAERGLEHWEAEATDEAWEKAEAEWAKMAVGEERKVIIE